MRAFTAAAVQLAPVPGPLTEETIKSNVDRCVSIVERCVAETGADLVIDPEKSDAVEEVLGHTAGAGADVVLEMSGHPRGVRLA